MNFGDRLAAARKAKNMSQEELAERLCVSRQTIYKWETEITYPDVDKLLDIAKALDVAPSYLLGEQKGDGESPTANDTGRVVRHFTAFARMIGACTLLVLVSVAVFLVLGSFESTPFLVAGTCALFAGLALAVTGYVVSGMRHDAFLKEGAHTVHFEKHAIQREQRSFITKISVGVAIILVSVGGFVVTGLFPAAPHVLALGVMLTLIGVASHLFITAGILHDLYTESQAALEPEKRHQKSRVEEAVSSIIMSVATVTFLILGFAFDLWHPAWVAFPIGGVLSGIVGSIIKLCTKEKEDKNKEV